MNSEFCSKAHGCANDVACDAKAASACEFGAEPAEPQGMVWLRKPYARRPELVTQAQADAMDSTMGALGVASCTARP